METTDFLAKVLGDAGATTTVLLAGMGDRLGLFVALDAGPATADELAGRTGLAPRYVAEWAAALTAAGYLAHDEATGAFSIPEGHRVALAGEGSPLFLGGMFQNLLGLTAVLDDVVDAFRTGDGVGYERYPGAVFEGMARMTGAAHDNVLVPRWLPTVPGLVERLEAGARVVDVGCGQGRALRAMAAAFPASTFRGIDAHLPVVEAALDAVQAAGLGGRVRIDVGDAATALAPRSADVVCLFDVLHDAADPPGLLAAVHAALVPGGTLLLLEPSSAPTIAGNAGPVGTLHYGMSVLYCTSVSLGRGGPGLGTCGTPEPVVRDLCAQAGFASLEEAPIKNLFNRLWAAAA